MKGKNILWIIVILVIVILAIYFGNKTHNTTLTSSSTEPIKIGFIGPLTGDAAALGKQSQAAVEIAIDEVNKAGGINGKQVDVVYEDGKCGTAAVDAAQKLINVDKVSAIIGGLCSSETSAFVKSAMQEKEPVISYCSSAPTLTGVGKYFFRDYPSDAFQGKFAAEYLYNTLGARKVAVFYHISDWGTGIKTVFEARFKELGGQILDEEGTPQTATDYKTQIAKIKTLNADYIYMPMYPEGGTIAVNQLNQQGVKTKIFGADAWSDPKFQKDISGKADILYSAAAVPPNDDFKSKLLAKSGGSEVSICSPQAYDAVKVLSAAIGKAGSLDADQIVAALSQTNYQGVSGNISFDSNNDLSTANYQVSRIENGASTPVK